MKTFWGQSFHQRQERVWAMGVIWSSALFWEHWATNNSTWQLHWVWPYGDIQISERSLWRRGGKGWGRILTWLLPITTHPLRMAEKIFCSLNCPSPKKKKKNTLDWRCLELPLFGVSVQSSQIGQGYGFLQKTAINQGVMCRTDPDKRWVFPSSHSSHHQHLQKSCP